MLRLLLCILVLFSSLSAYAEDISALIEQAKQNNSEAQYQLAIAYQDGKGIHQDPQEAFYWLQQAAENQHTQAIRLLAQSYLTGKGTEKDTSQAIYWLTRLAVGGDLKAQYELGKLYDGLSGSLSSSEMAEIWFHVSADKLPESEQAYSSLLEKKFNQQRAKQVSAIEQLDTVLDNQLGSEKDSPQQPSGQITQDYTFISLVIIFIAALLIGTRLLKNKNQRTVESEQKNRQEIANSSAIIKKQKRQIETLYKELKRYQQRQTTTAQDQKYQLACALFGYQPSQVPEAKEIKLRYKQLSKIYHPDMKGSEEEMKRLNNALKIILSKS